MASSPSSFIIDADLHGLVDGHIEADRRAEALRRLAISPADRSRVEAWQLQNDMLRRAFAGVDREPLPVILNLNAKPRLQSIQADESRSFDAMVVAGDGSAGVGPGRGRVALVFATILLIAAGFGATWMVLDSAEPEDTVVTTKLRDSIDATLAGRSSDAIDRLPAVSTATPLREGDRLPTTDIPDLRGAGFGFVGAVIESSDPASILFRYQNGTAERLAVSVAYATPQDGTPTGPIRIGGAFSWHKRDHAFSLAGTLRPGRLRAIALALQNDDLQN